MASNAKFVYGVGQNDAGYQVHETKMVDGRQISVWTCPFYDTWKSMLRRCYSEQFHERYPTYSDCLVSQDWLLFSTFREWMAGQQWRGMHLDKDILIPGNKVYGRDSCAFIHPKLNNFLTDNGAGRGKFRLGVSASSGSRPFGSRCSNPFTGLSESLGRFPDQKSAANAWRARKHQHACTYADMQRDPRVSAALRARFAMEFDA